MTRWLLPLSWLAFLAAFGWNLWVWGGLAYDPALGPRLNARLERQFSLPATYLGVGKPLLGWAGRERRAAEMAEGLLRNPPGVLLDGPSGLLVERVVAALPGWTRLSHHAAPWLLLLAMVLTWTTPKPVHVTTIGR